MTGNIQVLRIECRGKLTRAILAHSAGVSRPAIARKGMAERTNVTAAFRPNKAAALVKAARKARGKRQGRPPSEGVSMLFAGPPPYGSEGEWPADKLAAWAEQTTRWAIRCMGLPVVASALHRDEASPHLHLEFAAVKNGKFVPWREVRRRITGEDHHRRAMTKLQDMYHEEVASRFGLERGERKSGHSRKHHALAMTESVRALERERDMAAERKARLEAEAEAAERRRRRAEAAIKALRSQAQALFTERSRLLSKVKMARLLLKEGLGHIHKRRISARELIELGRELMRGEGKGEEQLRAPDVSDLPLEELLELASRPLRKRTTSEADLRRISEARDECKRRGIPMTPGRSGRVARRRARPR